MRDPHLGRVVAIASITPTVTPVTGKDATNANNATAVSIVACDSIGGVVLWRYGHPRATPLVRLDRGPE